MAKARVLVVGNGMVGHKLIDCLAQLSGADLQLTAVAAEPRLAYDRVQLSAYFSGASAEDLMLTSEQYYRDLGVRFLLGDKVVSIDRRHRYVLTESGHREDYDKLVLATGSYPFVPPIPGNDQPHCLVYRTIEDLQRITASAQQSKVGVVVGGGLLGLEAANALKSLGLEAHVVEFAPRLMAVQLDDGGGALLRRKIEALGVGVHTEKATTEIVAGEQCRYRMEFADGSFLETDMIVFSAGIRPQDALAREFGLEVGERGGIVINNHCQTSDDNIYAVGECALWQGRIFGLVAPGYTMARVAANHIVGGGEQFTGADMSTKLKLLGVDVASIGDAHGRSEACQSFVYDDQSSAVYKKLVVSADGSKLLGAVLVGDVTEYGSWLQLMQSGADLPAAPEALLLPLEDVAFDAGSLPPEALICACNSVTKGAIESAITGGATSLSAIQSATAAATGCGSCAVLVEQILTAQAADLSYEVQAGALQSGSMVVSGGHLTPDKMAALGAIAQEFEVAAEFAAPDRIAFIDVADDRQAALQKRLHQAGFDAVVGGC